MLARLPAPCTLPSADRAVGSSAPSALSAAGGAVQRGTAVAVTGHLSALLPEAVWSQTLGLGPLWAKAKPWETVQGGGFSPVSRRPGKHQGERRAHRSGLTLPRAGWDLPPAPQRVRQGKRLGASEAQPRSSQLGRSLVATPIPETGQPYPNPRRPSTRGDGSHEIPPKKGTGIAWP